VFANYSYSFVLIILIIFRTPPVLKTAFSLASVQINVPDARGLYQASSRPQKIRCCHADARCYLSSTLGSLQHFVSLALLTVNFFVIGLRATMQSLPSIGLSAEHLRRLLNHLADVNETKYLERQSHAVKFVGSVAMAWLPFSCKCSVLLMGFLQYTKQAT
jgi:hypothetical protein